MFLILILKLIDFLFPSIGTMFCHPLSKQNDYKVLTQQQELDDLLQGVLELLSVLRIFFVLLLEVSLSVNFPEKAVCL